MEITEHGISANKELPPTIEINREDFCKEYANNDAIIAEKALNYTLGVKAMRFRISHNRDEFKIIAQQKLEANLLWAKQ